MNLIPSLEREGGHIALLAVMVLICVALSYAAPDNQLVVKVGDMSMGALLLAMKGVGNKPISGNPAGEKPKENQ